MTQMYTLTNTDLVKVTVSSRHGFVAPEGYSLVAIDYSSQELFIAAVISNDQAMLNSFLPNDKLADYIPVLTADGSIKLENGKPVMAKNPLKDLHCLTAVKCCYPHIFKGMPQYDWLNISKNVSLISSKGCARDYGKKVNFGMLYKQTAPTMSEQNAVTVEVAEKWIKGHEKTYATYHAWCNEVADIAAARGWARNKNGRIRWVCN